MWNYKFILSIWWYLSIVRALGKMIQMTMDICAVNSVESLRTRVVYRASLFYRMNSKKFVFLWFFKCWIDKMDILLVKPEWRPYWGKFMGILVCQNRKWLLSILYRLCKSIAVHLSVYWCRLNQGSEYFYIYWAEISNFDCSRSFLLKNLSFVNFKNEFLNTV